MSNYHVQQYEVTETLSDGCGRLSPAAVLWLAQEAAGAHCRELAASDENHKGLFWAVLRYRVEVTRLPQVGETVQVKTWPLPTTKVAYPRAVEAFDDAGESLFRVMSLWVLMDEKTRQMVLPGKSGVEVEGCVLGGELPMPAGLKALPADRKSCRTVTEDDLDKNVHMNNTRYLRWAMDLLPAEFVENSTLKAFTACYFAEARLGDELQLFWSLSQEGTLYLDSYRAAKEPGGRGDRIFSANVEFCSIM